MKKLTLLRHAKSSWNDDVASDADRPLNEKGRRAAGLMGRYARDEDLRFDAIVASPATRVRETLDAFVEAHRDRDMPEPTFERRVYLASSVTLAEVVRELGQGARHLLLVGHNPGLEDLVLDCVPEGSDFRARVEEKYPTASLATMQFDIAEWEAMADGTGELLRFVRPRDLDASLGPDHP